MQAVPLLDLVRGRIHQADRDILIHEEQDRGHERGDESCPPGPYRQRENIHKPGPAKGGGERIGNQQRRQCLGLLGLGKGGEETPGQDTDGGGKIRDDVADALGKDLPASKACERDAGVEGGNRDDEGEEGLGEANGGVDEKGGEVLDCFVQEDEGDEEGEDLVGEACEVVDQIGEAGDRGEEEDEGRPDAHPGIEGEERQRKVLSGPVEHEREGQDGAGAADDSEGLPGEKRVGNAVGGGGQEHLHGPDVSLRELAHQASEGDGGGQTGEEQEEGSRHPLHVRAVLEVGQVVGGLATDVFHDAFERSLQYLLGLGRIFLGRGVGGRGHGGNRHVGGGRHGR